MKYLAIILILLVPLSCKNSQKSCQDIEVSFSPNGGVSESRVNEINKAESTILLQAYSFTDPKIGAALIAAHKRGVKVIGILDKENLGNPHSLLYPLHQAGILFFLDSKHSIAHNKTIIIDSETVISGSANLTKAADESNAENSIIIKDRSIATQYTVNWNLHKSHSEQFQSD